VVPALTFRVERTQAVLAAMKELGFLSADGETCTITNQALLYTGLKPTLN